VGGKVDKDNPTQVGRALIQLGVELIAAYSPEARGRSERMFGTLQKRLPQELRLAGITDMAAANRFLKETFIPRHNARFVIKPGAPGSAFAPFTGNLRIRCAFKKTGWSAMIIRCVTKIASCKFPPAATVTII
jgi:hypothetical protein